MFYTIYQITNKETGKTYIGKHQTNNLDDGYMGSGKHLKRAISKHGLKSFTKEILHVFDNEDEMNAKEAELVSEEFCSRDDTYNLCPGGKGGWGYVNTNLAKTDKQRESAKKVMKLIPKNSSKGGKTTKEKSIGIFNPDAVNGFKNKKHSEVTKQRISKTNSIKQSGKNNSQYGSIWITNGIESKKIKKEDLIPEGWRKGRKMK